jgi:hypothetical protein
MVRRRVSAVSNHEATLRLHPSKRGQDAAPRDEGNIRLVDNMADTGNIVVLSPLPACGER